MLYIYIYTNLCISISTYLYLIIYIESNALTLISSFQSNVTGSILVFIHIYPLCATPFSNSEKTVSVVLSGHILSIPLSLTHLSLSSPCLSLLCSDVLIWFTVWLSGYLFTIIRLLLCHSIFNTFCHH